MPRKRKAEGNPPPSRRDFILKQADALTGDEAKAAVARLVTELCRLWDESTLVREQAYALFVPRGIAWTFLSALAQAIRRHAPPEVLPLLEELDRF